jgi:hypothetical protein
MESVNASVMDLVDINVAVGEAEVTGDRERLEELTSADLVFRRADGTVVNQREFLGKVAPGKPRETEVESVTFFGTLRAVVTCVVRVGEERTPYHNVRLFHRSTSDMPWQLLAWANEPA